MFTFLCIASCDYSLLVGGPCVAIGERSKDIYNYLVYCKISDDVAVDSESKLLLTRADR